MTGFWVPLVLAFAAATAVAQESPGEIYAMHDAAGRREILLDAYGRIADRFTITAVEFEPDVVLISFSPGSPLFSIKAALQRRMEAENVYCVVDREQKAGDPINYVELVTAGDHLIIRGHGRYGDVPVYLLVELGDFAAGKHQYLYRSLLRGKQVVPQRP